MTSPDFDHFCRLMRDRSGLVLTSAKAYLVTGRLEPLAKSLDLDGVEALLAALRGNPSEALIQRCVDAMATHESSFFRDGTPFEQLSATVLPALIAARRTSRKLRIWCAACSSGQEPYSVAIALRECGALAGWTLEIVATDMSQAILAKARSGLYSDFEARRGLSSERLLRWFEPQGADWLASPSLRELITFQRHNLLQSAGGLGVFDVVFCRNVLIYFDADRKREVFGHLDRALAREGALFLGSSETLLGITELFEPVSAARGLYRRPLAVSA